MIFWLWPIHTYFFFCASKYISVVGLKCVYIVMPQHLSTWWCPCQLRIIQNIRQMYQKPISPVWNIYHKHYTKGGEFGQWTLPHETWNYKSNTGLTFSFGKCSLPIGLLQGTADMLNWYWRCDSLCIINSLTGWIIYINTSTWNFNTLWGKFNQSVARRVCEFQIKLLNMPIHLKVTLPLLNCYGKSSTYDMKHVPTQEITQDYLLYHSLTYKALASITYAYLSLLLKLSEPLPGFFQECQRIISRHFSVISGRCFKSLHWCKHPAVTIIS